MSKHGERCPCCKQAPKKKVKVVEYHAGYYMPGDPASARPRPDSGPPGSPLYRRVKKVSYE